MPINENRLRFGLYVGEGASHSWTWFVDLLEKAGCGKLSFLDEHDFSRKSLTRDVLLMSGGDTFAVAHALKASGPRALQAFLDRGGLYIGSCAGAYLPLHSSKEPLSSFNFVKSRINNLTKDLPPVHRLPTKFSNSYGACTFVYHPVREEVRVRMADDVPVWGGREVRVPLYGGPPLQESEDIQTRAVYSGFTDRTLFLADREVAERVYLGKVAACEKQIGEGRMVLLGPHFEHPWFPEGNDIILQWIRQYGRPCREEATDAVCSAGRDAPEGRVSDPWIRELKKEVSNMRIRAAALARQSVHWQIGAKYYEPEKIVHFLDAVWKRLGRVSSESLAALSRHTEDSILHGARTCHAQIRQLADRIRAGEESLDQAEALFKALKAFVVSFLEIYFQSSSGSQECLAAKAS